MTRPPTPASRTQAAHLKRCNSSAITRAARPGGPLESCVLPGGDIDVSHPHFERWQPAASKRRSPAPTHDETSTSAPTTPATQSDEFTIDDIESMTVAQVFALCGNHRGLDRWLATKKLAAEIHRLNSRNQRDDGRLISRAGVETFVFGYLESLHLRLLRNFPDSLLPQLSSLIHSGGTREEQLKVIRDCVTGELKTAKESILRVLHGDACRAGDRPPPTRDEKEPTNG